MSNQKSHMFDPKKLICAFGAHNIGGYADGTFINVKYDKDAFDSREGVDGIVTRVLRSNKKVIIEVTLDQSSASNDYLTSVHETDKAENVPLPLVIKDMYGRTVGESAQAWVKSLPKENPYADTAQNRVWQIECGQFELFLGGAN